MQRRRLQQDGYNISVGGAWMRSNPPGFTTYDKCSGSKGETGPTHRGYEADYPTINRDLSIPSSAASQPAPVGLMFQGRQHAYRVSSVNALFSIHVMFADTAQKTTRDCARANDIVCLLYV